MYSVSDTCGSVGYSLFDRGELVEHFLALETGDGRPAPATSEFHSTSRPTKLGDIPNMWRWTEQFLKDQDVLEPGITFDYFLGGREIPATGSARAVNPGLGLCFEDGETVLTIPPIERVDHVVLRRRK